jgi:predicted DNA-binding antitoxin AbrB/MazE fold protein
MALDFSQLKRDRSSVADLAAKLSKLTGNNERTTDDRMWYPNVDKAGNGYAVVRFLPTPKGEDVPFIRMWDHGFQGPGGWYIENSLTTIGQNDPVSEHNSRLWNSGNEADKEVARKQKRRLSFIANVLVIEDSLNPENNGKVRLFKFGKKIYDKLNEAMNPQFKDETPLNPFDFWEGADFRIKIRTVEGYRNYDKSAFDSASALFDGDEEKLKEVWESEHSLKEFLDPKNFKPYAELQAKLEKVLGLSAEGRAQVARKAEATKAAAEMPWDEKAPAKEAPKAKAAPAKEAPKAAGPDEDGDDEALDFFKKLSERK